MRNTSMMESSEFWKRLLNFNQIPYRKKEKDYSVSKNVNSEICASCGGQCCKTCGCHFSPDDFEEISFEFLKKEIEKGYISIEYVDREFIYKDSGAYILRIRNTGASVVDVEFDRTPCILLTDKGCKLSYEQRPTGGKLLIPSRERDCKSNYTIQDCCDEWMQYQEILCELVKFFRSKEIPCLI